MDIDIEKATAAFPAFLKSFAIDQPAPTPDPIPVPDPTPTPTPGKKMADFADVLYNSDNIVVNALGNVSILKAVKGGPNLEYTGLEVPTLALPYVSNNNEVVFLNQPNVTFAKQTRDNNNPFPLTEEFTFVLRRFPGTDWETLMNKFGMPYFGWGGLKQLRALNSGLYFKNEAPMNYFELAFLHFKIEPSAGGNAKCTAWVNGTSIGSVTSTGGDWSKRLGYAVGTDTNSADYNWFASAFIERGMSDAERAEYFDAIKKEYPIGSIPQLPYASNVGFMNTGSKLIASYNYNGSASEDTSKVKYFWYKQSPDLVTQKLIGTGPNIPFQKGSIKVCVQVFDKLGYTWQPVSGTYN